MNLSLFKTIFETARTGMILLGKDSQILYANETFCGMSGLRLRQLEGLYFTQLITPADKEDFNAAVQMLSADENPHFLVTVKKLDPEQERWWQCDLHFQNDQDTGKKFIFGIISDITEQKKGHEQLKSAKAAAEKSTKTKADFVANMSHELRTPIHTIIGMNELLLETKLDPEQMEYADQVRFSADVLLSLVNDILDFSKIEAGKLSLEKIEFDLHRLTEDAIDLVALEAHKKDLEVVIDIRQDVPCMCIGDPTRLRQIIVNLFNNAVKFTEEGEITVILEKGEEKELKTVLKFTVRDTGIGIPREKVGKLFRAFSQIDTSTTRKYGGTGLGLSISQNLAKLMGGDIGVSSEYGRGSSFWFTVEMKKGGQSPVCMPVDDQLENLKVLVVDDNQRVREVLGRYLESWGYKPDAEPGGAEALEALRRGVKEGAPYAACLIDLVMPGMDGWQLASEINADKEINFSKLVLLSPAGKSGEEAKMKLLHWFDEYLSKPVKKRKLYNTLVNILRDESDLELVEEVGELEELSEEEEGAGTEGTPSYSVLIAEDHEVNQQLFKAILESLGHQVDAAFNGKDAVDLARKKDYDIIFMDVQMPEMNGYEATMELRKMGVEIPIIAATASAVKEEQDKCSEAGMDDLLIKPFKKKDVVPMLEKWAANRSPKAAAPEPPPQAEEPAAEAHRESTPPEEAAPTALNETTGETSGAGDGPEIFNFDQAVETFMGKREVVLKVLKSFIDKVEDQLPKMESAAAALDLETLRGEAHSIKGGGLNLEVNRLGNKAKELEDACREGRRDEVPRLLGELKTLFKEFLEYVSPMMSSNA
jgi:two-component system, sensor histidine kinase and response regulator